MQIPCSQPPLTALDVLAELVALKDLKDREGKTLDYERRQPAALEAARKLVAEQAQPLDPALEAACAAYLLAWPKMTEEAKAERRTRMRLALDAARAAGEG